MPTEQPPINSLPRGSLRKLLRSKTESNRYWDLKNKLEVLAVKCELKPAFLASTGPSVVFQQLAALFDLYVKVTEGPPPHYMRKANVTDNFLKASMEVMSPKRSVMWLYSDIQVESLISRCINGELNEGSILGYPQCCIEWHARMRVPEMESCFRQIEERIRNDPQMLRSVQARTELEMYRFILRHWRSPPSNYMIETMRRYPFVPHYACPLCLSRNSKESEKFNNQYRKLAAGLSPEFAQEIEQSTSDSLRAVEKSLNEQRRSRKWMWVNNSIWIRRDFGVNSKLLLCVAVFLDHPVFD